MIVLDTNVVSELGRYAPDTRVLAWSESAGDLLTITAVTAAEMTRGVSLLPRGARRDALAASVTGQLMSFEMRGGVLPFDARAAHEFGDVAARRKAAGRPIADADAMIAAICRAHGAPLATRNIKDFTGTGVTLINPWDEPPT